MVQKASKRYIFHKGKTISEIKIERGFNYSKEQIFINKNFVILDDDYKLVEHIECVDGIEYHIDYDGIFIPIVLPKKATVLNCKKIIQQQLEIKN